MRILTVSLLVLFTLLINPIYARDPNEQIIIVNQTQGGGRNEGSIPEVYYSDSDGDLEIAFDSSDLYVLEIFDEYGTLVYSSMLITDGDFYSYSMSLNAQNTYYITITSTDGCFEGVIDI